MAANIVASSSNNNKNNNNGTGKKLKASPPAPNVPRCQAEGCRTDLSNAKDYHRRHKVCEWHSKASKVKVGDIEQRFCQQCSRFHVLAEFDEGKRSCRRRLAGHNERRRKTQPEAMSLLSSGSFANYLQDDNRLLRNALLEHPCSFVQHQRASAMASSLDPSALACQLRFSGPETQALKFLRVPKEEPDVANFPPLELHHFMQGTGSLMGGHGLELSNTAGAAPLSSASPSGFAVSGRALSLLSSSLGSANNPHSMTLSVPPSTIEQLLAENQATLSRQMVPSSSPGQPCFTSVSDKVIGIARPQCSLTNSNEAVDGSPTALDKEPSENRVPMANFDGRSLFIMQQDNDLQGLNDGDSQHGRPILDLMHISSPQSQGSRSALLQQSVGVQYTELEGLRSYEAMFGRQNIM